MLKLKTLTNKVIKQTCEFFAVAISKHLLKILPPKCRL